MAEVREDARMKHIFDVLEAPANLHFFGLRHKQGRQQSNSQGINKLLDLSLLNPLVY